MISELSSSRCGAKGQTVGDVAGRVLNRRVRLLFLLLLFMALTIVLAIFGSGHRGGLQTVSGVDLSVLGSDSDRLGNRSLAASQER